MKLFAGRRGFVIVGLVWMATAVSAFGVGVYAHRNRAALRAMLGAGNETSVLQTNLYNLRVVNVPIPAEGRDGGIAALGDGILFTNRKGRFWFVDGEQKVTPLALRVPINLGEFEADPYNESTVGRELFGVKDLLVQPHAGGIRILASHNHWLAEQDCYALRVSSMETTYERLLSGADSAGDWTTEYETTPCRPLTQNPNGRTRNPSLAAAGRMVSLSEDEVLVTVGGFGPETDLVGPSSLDTPYGKTILVDLPGDTFRIYTQGHRNPEGLAISGDGEVWLTEHGDRGGDELNRLTEGRHYGYPYVSYGTAYGQLTFPNNPRQGRHDGYEQPMFVWTPGIGVSQLIVLEGSAFPHWKGDLFVTSLAGRSVFRVRVEEGRTIFAEQFPIDRRIRDIVEAKDGSIVLKTDDDLLVYLMAVDVNAPSFADLPPEQRGAILASQCQSCHALRPDQPSGIGPSLWGVVGRRIGARDDYAYSPAFRALDGTWTEAALTEFMKSPDGFAPGTTMLMPGTYDESQIADLVAYLRTLE